MRLLLLGGTGILSHAIATRAVAAGHRVTLVNRGWSRKRPVPDGCRVIHADVRAPGELAAAIGDERFDAVVDFVAFTPADIRRDHELFAGRTGQFVFISTIDAYEKPPREFPITERTPLGNPFWSYGSNKVACEELLAELHAADFPVTIVRPAHTYDAAHIPLLGEWTAMDRMRRGAPVVVHGDGSSIWTLTHASDFAAAFMGLLGAEGAAGESFHITSDEWLSWDRIAELLAEAAGLEARIVHVTSDQIAAESRELGAALLGDRTHSAIFDTTKIKAAVPGWTARRRFADGAREIVDWYAARPERRRPDESLDALFDRLVDRYA